MIFRAKLVRFFRILKRAIIGFVNDDGSALSGYMAYTALLSMFPFLIFATALTGLLIGPDGLTPVLDYLFGAFPEHVAKTIQPVIEEVVHNRSGKVLGLSALGTIWIASNGFEAQRTALDRAYNTTDPHCWWINRLVSIIFVFIAVVAFALLAVLIVFGPELAELAQEFLGLTKGELDLWHWTRYIAGVVILGLFLTACHVALPGKHSRVPIFPGIFFTVILWLMMATLFSIYFRYMPSYAITYGTLGGVIATLLFFYVSSAIFIFGAEINSAVGAIPKAGDPDTKDSLTLKS